MSKNVSKSFARKYEKERRKFCQGKIDSSL